MVWFFVIITAGAFIGFMVHWTGRSVLRKREALFNAKTSPAADERDRCMVRECFMEEPGVVQVLDGNLCIHTVTGKDWVIPISQVKLVNARKNKYWIGSYSWWGKTCFKLETPRTSGLVLGVDDPESWRRILKGN